jgi:hypothetical protein
VSEITSYVPPLPDLSRGEALDLTVKQLIRHMKVHFLEVGGLLAELHEGAWWTACGFDRWQDYVESLGIGSYEYVMGLIGISKMMAAQVMTIDELNEVGYSKACLLVPLHNKGKLSAEIISLAKTGTNLDLRKEIGYRVPENDENCRISCPHCGQVLYGVRYVAKGK